MKRTMYHGWLIALLFSAGLFEADCYSQSSTDSAVRIVRPVRGVWVANVGTPTLTSIKGIHEFVDLADRCGINTLYVVVWNRGMTTYPSEIMLRESGQAVDPRYQEFDMLKEIVDAAHAKKIRVIAWFEFGFSCSYEEPDGGWLIRKHPDWAALDVDGKLVSKDGFQWMNGSRPEVQDFVLSLLKEILTNYDVDGVQGDDRLPGCPSTGGYDPWTVKLYKEQHAGREPPADHLDPDWIEWRANLLNEFMGRMYREMKATRPDAVVSAAPSIYPWCKQQYLQDWPIWIENGWVDEICPQIYRSEVAVYEAELKKIVDQFVAPENYHLLSPGILVLTADGDYNDTERVQGMVEANRAVGIEGEVFFYDAALNENREFFESLYK
ncbi:glycoside hydrolase family 10 protein [Bythopirellula polymerisocia]|uniref:Glycosyl hydrolase-like 10 domain-containing protein n=1 Tax=Bythopirellula polymerisocia TaxID=2528003 RepID=A0A5C6CHY0_9BACT|nr:family 10 glycosylhydrolase [Bythopirellula polymerisocia]TWU23665.1 hypothetical protein Pla144_38400 [Bythopirellula polymerisocia]